MMQGDPWSVKGVKPELRDAATQAAQQAGVPLGEWLNRVIAGRPAGSDSPDDAASALVEQSLARAVADTISGVKAESSTLNALDSVARWIETADSRRRDDTRTIVTNQDRHGTVLRDAIDHVSRKVDSIERTVDAAAPAPSIKAALERIENRLERSEGRPAASVRVDETLRELESRYSALARSLSRPEPAPATIVIQTAPAVTAAAASPLPTDERLARAVAAIRAQQETLDADPAAQPASPQLSSIGAEIAQLTSRIDALLSAPPKADTALQELMAGIRAQLAQSDPTPQLDNFGRRLDGLSARLDTLTSRMPPSDGLAALRKEVADLRGTMEAEARSGVTPQAARDADVRPVALTALQCSVDDLSATLSSRLPPALGERLDSLEQRISRISETGQAAPSPDLAPLDAKLDELARRIASTGQAAPALDLSRLDARLDTLAQRLDELRKAEQQPEGIAALRDQIAELALRLEKVDAGFRGVSGLERTLDDLMTRLQDSDRLTAEAVRTAAGETLRSAGVTDPALLRRIDARLEGLHEKLASVAGKLESAAPDSAKPAEKPSPAPSRPAEPEKAPAPSNAEKLAAATAAAEAARAALAQAQKKAAQAAPADPRRGVDPRQLVAAARAAAARAHPEPLELVPAMDAPRVAATIPVPPEEVAAEQGPVAAEAEPGEALVSPVDALRSYAARRRRPLLIGVAAAVAVIGVLHALRDEFAPAPVSEEIPAEVSAPAEPGGIRAPAATDTLSPDAASPAAPASPVVPAPAPKPQSSAEPAPALPKEAQSYSPFSPEPQTVGSLGKLNETLDTAHGTVDPSAKATGQPAPKPPFTEPLPSGLPASLAKGLQAGDPVAAYELSARYADGKGGMPRDAKLAAVWLEQAAQRGFAPAQYRLGSLYERGLGVTRDPAKARQWYETAADAGNVKAMHNLGVLFADASSGKPDYAAAATWFRKAAEYGLRDSEYNLAVLAGRGLGIAQNLPEAYVWFSLAAAQGDQDAAAKREEVAARLDPASLATAKASVQAFRPKTALPAANDVAPPADPLASDARKDKAKPAGT